VAQKGVNVPPSARRDEIFWRTSHLERPSSRGQAESRRAGRLLSAGRTESNLFDAES